MSKKNNSAKMRVIRKRIDEVDSKILPLMVKRSKLVSKALDVKTKKSEIVDLKRINQIKKRVAAQAKKLGASPKLISNIWVSIIKNFIDFEKKILKNNYLLCGGSFFSTNHSCFFVAGLYFFILSFSLAFNPEVGFFA